MRRSLALAFVVCITTLTFGQFEHPDLKSGKKQVSVIVLMPIQAEITKVGMKGAEPMEAESREVEKTLAPVVAEALRNMGCTVQDSAFTPDAFEKDAELRYTVDDLQKEFDSVLGQMTKKSKDVRKGRFTIGDSVAKLPAGADADSLLFVRATGQVLTGGKKAFGWLVTGQVWEVVQMQLGLVDAKTGEVLYFAKPIMLKNLAKDAAQTRSGIEKSFKNFVKTRKLQAGTNKAS